MSDPVGYAALAAFVAILVGILLAADPSKSNSDPRQGGQ